MKITQIRILIWKLAIWLVVERRLALFSQEFVFIKYCGAERLSYHSSVLGITQWYKLLIISQKGIVSIHKIIISLKYKGLYYGMPLVQRYLRPQWETNDFRKMQLCWHLMYILPLQTGALLSLFHLQCIQVQTQLMHTNRTQNRIQRKTPSTLLIVFKMSYKRSDKHWGNEEKQSLCFTLLALISSAKSIILCLLLLYKEFLQIINKVDASFK